MDTLAHAKEQNEYTVMLQLHFFNEMNMFN